MSRPSMRDFADCGAFLVTSGTPVTTAGDFFAMQVLEEVTITTATFVVPGNYRSSTMLNTVVLPPDVYWFRLATLTISAGRCVLYKN